MKKYSFTILIFFVIMSFASFVLFQINSKNHLKVMLAYSIGQKLAQAPFSLKTGCKLLPEFSIPFCHEGFSEAVFRKAEGNFPDKMKTWKDVFPMPAQTELIGAGIAVAQDISTAIEIESVLLKQDKLSEYQLNYILDGWAFAQLIYHQRNFAQAMNECAQLKNDSFKKICWFGIGRSYYFLNQTKTHQDLRELSPLEENQTRWLLKGYGFANSFAGLKAVEQETNAQITEGMKVGLEAQKSFQKLNQENSIQKCLSEGQHFAFCH